MTLPFPAAPSYSLQVYLGNVQRRERNPAGRGDRGREREGEFSPFFFSFLWLHFSAMMDSFSRGSRRGDSRHISDLVRNFAVPECVFFSRSPTLLVHPEHVRAVAQRRSVPGASLWRGMLEKPGRGVICPSVFGGGGRMYGHKRAHVCVCAFLGSDSRIP